MKPIDTIIQSYKSSATGAVTLRQGSTRKTFIFKRGQIVHVQSDIRSETLGMLLVEEQKITPDQLHSVLERMKETGKMQGDTLIEMGLVSAPDVFQYLNIQMIEKLKSTLRMTDCEVTFSDNVPENLTNFSIPLFSALLAGLIENYTTERFKSEFDMPLDLPVTLTEEGKKSLSTLGLQIDEIKVLNLLNRKGTFVDVVEWSEDRRLATALLFLLYKLQFITTTSAAKEGTAKDMLGESAEASEPKAELHASAPVKPLTRITVKQRKPSSTQPATEQMYKLLLKMQKMTYYEILNVKKESTASQIERAYNQLVAKYKLLQIDEAYESEHRENAKGMFDLITHAYLILKKPGKKAEYDKMSYPEQRRAKTAGGTKLQAEMHMLKAEMHIQKGNLDLAREVAKEALKQNPLEPDYLVTLADIELRIEKKSKRKVVESLRKALDLDPRHHRAHLVMGYYYKHLEQFDRAANSFREALRVNPHCKEAEAELRLLEMREPRKKRGLFAALMGRR